jgi:hypothetical protein
MPALIGILPVIRKKTMIKQGFSLDNGFIIVPRDFINWEWFENSNMVHLFLYLRLRTNYADSNYKGVEVKRGQVLTGLNSLVSKTGISRQSVRTCLNKLKKANLITINSTKKYSIITICDYESYQTSGKSTNKKNNIVPTPNQHSANTQLTTSKEILIPSINTELNIKKEEGNNIFKGNNKINPPPVLEIQIQSFLKDNPCKYSEVMLNAFRNYWGEKFIKGNNVGKERWQEQKTWELSKRLATWKQNEKKFNPNHDESTELSSAELIEEGKRIFAAEREAKK